MELDIDEYLAKLQARVCRYLPNPGNAGDSLIVAAI